MNDTDEILKRRYLTGSLTEEEHAMFEERILTDPTLQEDIELTHAMRAGIRELAKRGELHALMSEVRPFWGRPLISIAASVAAMVFASASIFLYTRTDNSAKYLGADAKLAPSTSHEVLRFELTRSAGSIPDVAWRRRAVPTLLEFQFDVGIAPGDRYEVVIARSDGVNLAPLLIVPSTNVVSEGTIQVSMHSGLLHSGDYQITVAQHGSLATDDPPVYSLRVLD